MEESRFKQLGEVAKSPKEMIALIIIEHQYNVDLALEDVDRHKCEDEHTIIEFKARLKSYLILLLPYLNKNNKGIQVKDLIIESNSDKLNMLRNLYAKLDQFCYDLGLTKIDTEEVYDPTDGYEEDLRKGLIG